MNRLSISLLLALGLTSLAHAQLAPLPEGGVVLRKGQKLQVWTDGVRVNLGRSIAPRDPLPAIKDIQSLGGGPPGLFRFEAKRRLERNKELKKSQRKTIGKGFLTEIFYKKVRKKKEK